MTEPVDEVITALHLVLDALEDVAEEVKEAARHSLEEERLDDLARQSARISEIRDFAESVGELRHRWSSSNHPTDGQRADESGGSEGPSRTYLGRVPRGTRTPEVAFRRPILEVLVELGGSGSIQDVLDRVGERLDGQLRPIDFEPLPSTPDTLRWRNTAQWSRNELVRTGLMEPVRTRGVWEISAAGRAWLERSRR